MTESDPSNLSTDLPIGSVVEDDSASPALRKAALHGQTVSLIPVDAERDARRLYEISHGGESAERVWTYLGYGPFADLGEMQRWLEECARSEDPLFFTVVDRRSSRAVGLVSFLSFHRPSRRVELGHIWYGADYQRGRTNTETIYLMLCEAFDRLNCRRVEWKCDSANRRSGEAALRLGFQYEGTFRQHLIVKGRNRDTAWYSIVDREWPQVQEALEKWLEWGEGCPPSLATLRGEGP